jgi:hypothetical protein
MNGTITTHDGGVSFEWSSHEEAVSDIADIQTRHKLDSMIVLAGNHYKQRQGYGSSDYWYGCSGWYEGIMSRIQNGWPELRELAEAMAAQLGLEVPVFPTKTTLRKRKRHRDDHGDTLDMGRVWNGDLDTAWERPVHVERQQVNQKRVTLAFDIASNCTVSHAEAMWRTALCMLLVDGMARAGRTMEVWITTSGANVFRHGPRKLWQGWCVKKTNEPLVPDRMAAMLSVGYFRSMGFIGFHAGPWTPSSGYGYTLNYGLPKTLLDRQKGGETVLRIGECYSKRQAIAEYTRAFQSLEKEAA